CNQVVFKKNVACGMCIKAVFVSNNNPHSHSPKNPFCLIKMRIVHIITLLVTIIFFTIDVALASMSFGVPLTIRANDEIDFPIFYRGQMFVVYFDTGSTELWLPDITCANCGHKTKFNPIGIPTSDTTIVLPYGGLQNG